VVGGREEFGALGGGAVFWVGRGEFEEEGVVFGCEGGGEVARGIFGGDGDAAAFEGGAGFVGCFEGSCCLSALVVDAKGDESCDARTFYTLPAIGMSAG